MEPNDNLPSDPVNRAITIHLTRDTLLLVAALAFLAVAILLAVIFPDASSSNMYSANTAVAQVTADQVAVTRQAPTATYIAVASVTTGVAQRSYPGTNDAAQSTTSTALPIFSPSQPTAVISAFGIGENQTYPLATSTSTSVVITQQATPSIVPTVTPGATVTATPPVFQPGPTNSPVPEISPTQNNVTPILPPTAIPLPTVTPRPPTVTPVPTVTPIPVTILRGNIRWTQAQSPIRLTRDQQLAPGSSLVIEPGVEVQLAPGISFYVEGTLFALGNADQHVRIVASSRQRWEGLFGRPGSTITLEYTDLQGGGAGGTLMTSESGSLALRNVHMNDNGGHIQTTDSRIEMRDSEIAGNDLPYGAALDSAFSSGGFVILSNNRIGGNRQQTGSPPVAISSESSLDILNLDLQGNLFVGQNSPDLVLSTNGPLQGTLTCNAFIGGTDGLSIRGEAPQVPSLSLTIHDNATEKHTPPIIPIYLQYGIGRGATSEIALDMRHNWWGSELGPYDPDRHADGRGQAVGSNIEFDPWLTTRPACAPIQ